jgi:hypothetical protein
LSGAINRRPNLLGSVVPGIFLKLRSFRYHFATKSWNALL